MFNVLLLVILHGTSSVKLFTILLGNCWLVKHLRGSKWFPVAVWGVNVGMLFANEWFDGFPYGKIHPSLAFLVRQEKRQVDHG
jgi:hypothetical protein